MSEKIRKVPLSISVTEEQAAFLKTLPNRSEVFQKFIQELMLTQNLTGQEKANMEVANEITEYLVRDFIDSVSFWDHDQEEEYVTSMASALYDAAAMKKFHRMGLIEEVKSAGAKQFLEHLCDVRDKEDVSPKDLQTIRVIFNEVRKRLVQEYQKVYARYPPRGWDEEFDQGAGYKLKIIPP